MIIDLIKFRDYCELRKWDFNEFTSEFTFQFRLCRYIEDSFDNQNIELESNINRYKLFKLSKKEIDIDILTNDSEKIAIEIKYIRDFGSHNIGMFEFCKDIKFLEELVEQSFSSGIAIIFTTIPNLYTSPNSELKPKNIENINLYNAFRINKNLRGELKIKTGKMDKSLILKNSYPLQWIDFTPNIKACIVNIK